MLTLLARLVKALNSDDSPAQIAAALVLALFVGVTPLWSVHNLVIALLVLVLRINLSMFLAGWGVFTLFAYLLDPLSHQLGLTLLDAASLQGLWNSLYQSDFWRLLAFNNTIVLGSFFICLLLSPILYGLSVWLVSRYRSHVMAWAQRTRLSAWLKSSKLFSIYQSLQG